MLTALVVEVGIVVLLMNGVAYAPAVKASELTARIASKIIPYFVFIFFAFFAV